MTLNLPRVVCIGNFDGVHRGHQALLQAAADISPHVIALTFEPHPRELFRPNDPPFRINSPAQKNDLLRRFGAREIITMPFTWEFAALTAEEFVEKIIIKQTKADHVVVGSDFHFGKDRAGNIALLQAYADKGKFALTVLPLVGDKDKWSSTNVRGALHLGDMMLASEILGWDYAIQGEVVKGDQRGRTMGFPTANMKLDRLMPPAFGVYASFVYLYGQRYMGATNIGIRPMFESALPLIETHIFDFDQDIYGQILSIQPVKRLRGEAKYESLEALITQIGADCKAARELLTSLA